MTQQTLDPELLDRLATFDSLRNIPRTELAWIIAHGEHRHQCAGEVVLSTRDESKEMIVQLSGRIVVYFGHAAGRRHAALSRAGSITGLLPFSRLKRPPSDVLVEEDAEYIAVNKDLFPEMIRDCPVLVESLVHNMLDRARRFAAADWQDEKVMSLGRLAAGLAHELNNPSAAASREATRLVAALHEASMSAHRFGMAHLDDGARQCVVDIVERCQDTTRRRSMTSVERSDAEDKICEWLEEHDGSTELAGQLVDAGLDAATLDTLAASLEADAFTLALRWIASSASAAAVAHDVQLATHRIHDVISAVRDFAHLDRAAVREPMSIAPSLQQAVSVLKLKAAAKHVTIDVDIDPALPQVSAVVQDLNVVWSHLIENAVDAVSDGGTVTIRATVEGQKILVSVRDNGVGIPEDIQSRIFDPFFTTKPVGSGIGLGLDVVRRTLRDFDGDVEFESRPGLTEFRVRLPVH